MSNKVIEYIQNSFLSPLLQNDEVTDITYNGENIFYMHNKEGRKKSLIKIDANTASDFIRQIANFTEKSFSFTEPLLDLTIGKYRINAVHQSIVRVRDSKAISFAIRISSQENRVRNDKNFMNKTVLKYLQSLLNNNESIVISGATGTGKTELQKYLITLLKENSHIVVIDNIQELETIRNDNLDITTWQVTSNSSEKTFESLIRNALRNNPDWLIIAEARGKEMSDALLSVMSGHPIITTLHASNSYEAPNRITRMIQLANPNQQYAEIYNDVVNNIHNYVYLERKIDNNGKIERYIKSIVNFDVKKKTFRTIYERKINEKI
ncbi:MAG: Flp pilus assembly complex ATPase component TadA [Bacilli bacterium]|nr:Flp pilus assembly complex ATPase component TadA [Bacilli bacterium]